MQDTDFTTDIPEQSESELVRLLGAKILERRDDAMRGRAASGIEKIWREAEKAFDGVELSSRPSVLDYVSGEATLNPNRHQEVKRSQVEINIVRGKVETAEGRFCDIMLPTEGKNWGLKPTPVPGLSDALKSDMPVMMGSPDGPPMQIKGEQATVKDVARAAQKEAEKKMNGMENKISDQLVECRFNSESRRAIRDAARIGTGILKGPVVTKQSKKVWKSLQTDEGAEICQLEIIEEFAPASRRVDPWNIYPDPYCGEDIEKAAYIWEYDTMLPKEIVRLIGVDGYLEDQIREVLNEDPIRVTVGDNNSINRERVEKGRAYEKWEYHGDIDREVLQALGCDCDAVDGSSLSACVVYLNDRPIKAQLNPLDTGDLPYDFFQWTEITGSVFGLGLSNQIIWQQRVITAAWRAMMDNAGDSSGANVVVSRGVEPADGKWELTGKKLWVANADVEDTARAFSQFQIANNQSALQAIIDLALKFVDIETSIPMLFQGEKGTMPETLGATNIMVDANNVALRSRVKRWDDQITTRHITRYYDWNMQYSDDPNIKADLNVDARGSSVLLEKDQRAMAIGQTLSLRGDPELSQKIDWKKALEQLFKAQHLDILKDEENEEKQQPQEDPRIAANMKIAQIRTQGELQKAELVQSSDMAELQFKAQEAERQRQHERELKEMELAIKQMEFAEKTQLSLDKIKADLALGGQKLKTQVALSQSGGKGPQVITPPVEPPGRAPDGRAFPE